VNNVLAPDGAADPATAIEGSPRPNLAGGARPGAIAPRPVPLGLLNLAPASAPPAIASVAVNPGRVVGLHFFNPVPAMALVEVIAASTTDPATAANAARVVTGWGKTPVRSADSPGFIVNRINRPFTIEALRMIDEKLTTASRVDSAIKSIGYPMGPFELMDLIGPTSTSPRPGRSTTASGATRASCRHPP
jgi:hypothetical protein